MKKKILLMILCGVCLLGLTGCGNSEEKMIKEAKILDWDKVLEETDGNAAKAEDYENRLYAFYGRIQEINKDSCNVSGMIVELKKERLKELKLNDSIVVIGTLKDATTKPKLANAIGLDNKTIKKNYLIELDKKNVSASTNEYTSTYKYSNYTFDKNKRLVTSYKETNTTFVDKEDQKSTEYKLKYDKKDNIIEKKEQFGSSTKVYTYLYNKDNTILKETYKDKYTTTVNDYTYEKDKEKNIIKKIEKTDNGEITSYAYEYDNKGRKIREVVESPTHNWDYKFEYNKNGKLVKKSWNGGNSKIEYEYDQFGNVTKEEENSNGRKVTTIYYYGIVGKKS